MGQIEAKRGQRPVGPRETEYVLLPLFRICGTDWLGRLLGVWQDLQDRSSALHTRVTKRLLGGVVADCFSQMPK